jgi:hypothetical protein
LFIFHCQHYSDNVHFQQGSGPFTTSSSGDLTSADADFLETPVIPKRLSVLI